MRSKQAKHFSFLILKIFLGILVFVVILGAGTLIFLQTESGREFARKQLNKAITGQMQGKLELEYLDDIGLNTIEARNLVITAPNGEKVMEFKKISMNPSWSQLLIGKIHASSATVTGGTVRITEIDKKLTINKTFSRSLKLAGKKKGDPVPITFENIQGHDLEVLINTPSFSEIAIQNIESLVQIEVADRRVVLRLDDTRAHFKLPLLGDTKIRQLSGQIKSKVEKVISFKLNLELGDMVPTKLTYLVPKNEQKPGDPKMVIRFSKEKSPDFFSKLVLKAADGLSSFLDVGFEDEVKVPGTPKSDKPDKSDKPNKPDPANKYIK